MEIPTQTTDSTEAGKARRKPGTRRLQILQTLASMLEDPRRPGGQAGRVGGGLVPPFRQQGPDVRGLDRVHRDDDLRADQ